MFILLNAPAPLKVIYAETMGPSQKELPVCLFVNFTRFISLFSSSAIPPYLLQVMSLAEKEVITDLKKCNFKEMCEFYKMKSEERKAMTKEQKNAIKAENEALIKEYGFCVIDGHKQKIGNFRIEPPGLFRGRGDHPKQGMHKKRIGPQDVLINCSKYAWNLFSFCVLFLRMIYDLI